MLVSREDGVKHGNAALILDASAGLNEFGLRASVKLAKNLFVEQATKRKHGPGSPTTPMVSTISNYIYVTIVFSIILELLYV